MYHFIGIKGSGMSALAQIMQELGHNVQGSDVDKHFFTEIGLMEKNIPILSYNKNNISLNMNIVLGNSIKDDNEELIQAKNLGLTIYSYQEMIGELTKQYKTVAVTGCHGKTTTTSMLSHILDNTIGCNFLIGDGTGNASELNELFVLEACEYQRHFLSYYPKYLIVTNIELDHVDYFKDIDDVIDAYTSMINQTSDIVIAWGDDPYIRTIKTDKKILYYGLNDNNNIVAKNVIYNSDGSSFDVYINDEFYHSFNTQFFGEHIILNSLAAIAICYLENIDKNDIAKYLLSYSGAKRRFNETKIKDCVIIDDYAHHPTEIIATINSAKLKYPNKKIVAVFQPHTFTRTSTFINEYIEAFKLCDKSFLLDIHPAREKQEDYPNITSDVIVSQVNNSEIIKMDEKEKLLPYNNDVILFMSANDLNILKDGLIDLLKNT